MPLKQQITDAMKQAMRAQDKIKLAAIRLILAEIKQIEIDQRIELSDAEVIGVLDKMVKKHRDSIEQFGNAQRQDLVDKEQQELDVIQQFLPQPLTQEEIDSLVKQAIADTQATSKKDMGKVMNKLRPQVIGKVDMKLLSQMISKSLS